MVRVSAVTGDGISDLVKVLDSVLQIRAIDSIHTSHGYRLIAYFPSQDLERL